MEPWYAIVRNALVPPLRLWFTWRFEGLERIPSEGPLIVAGNHLSYLDPLAHGIFVDRAGRRPRFLAKQELFESRFLRTVLLGCGQIPVRRGTGDQTPLLAAARAIRAGEVIVIYPEGTSVSDRPDFSPMRGKTGAVRLSAATGVPILPVATWGGQYVWRRGARLRPAFGRPVWLAAGSPIPPPRADALEADPELARRLTDELMAELAALVADLRARYPKRWG